MKKEKKEEDDKKNNNALNKKKETSIALLKLNKRLILISQQANKEQLQQILHKNIKVTRTLRTVRPKSNLLLLATINLTLATQALANQELVILIITAILKKDE